MQTARVIYFEIPTQEPQRCMDFYAKVFGWEFSKLEDCDQWLCRTGTDERPGINGSIKLAKNGNEPVCNTLYVQDLEQTRSAILNQGGWVQGSEVTVPGLGQMLYFKDPEGNLHGALQPFGNANG